MREAQRSFQKTGGLHAAGLFKIDGTFLHAAEDVGRHNAMDKLIGWGLDEVGEDWSGHILVLSGRASFELVQKAISVRVPIVASVGAPSTLAVDLAEEFNITLAGFVRGKSFNVYTHPHRIQI
jgi:FdhD protein